MASENKTLKRGIELYIDGKQVQANMKQVEAEAKKLREQIRGMTVGSNEYFEATNRYRELDVVLRNHRAELRSVAVQHESLFNKGVRWFKEYSLQITGAIAALTGVAMKLNQLRKQAHEKEDAAANLKALTGLDDENIQWLTQQAEKISTTMEDSGLRVRKSATEILEAYMLVGSKKPELLKDKEALNAVTIEAMRLAEASNMELKDAVAGVTIAMNQYSASANEAARYTNVLAAGSKFGAVNVATQTESIVKAGVAASTAKVPIEQLVGVLETLGERGIEGNRAGTQLKTFFLKLEAGAKETRPSVVGLQTALERLKAQNLDTTEITKRFGLETYSVAQALIDSTDKLKSYTEAVTGTNVAVEQAAINSGTAAAKMAQIRNQLNLTGQELAKTLAPVFSLAVGWTRKFIMAMPPVIDFMKKYGKEILIVSAYLLVLSTYQKAVALWTTTWASVAASVKAYSAAMILAKDAVVGCSLATTRLTALMAAQNIVTKAVTATAILLKTAYYGLTLQFTAASRSLAAFNAVAHINPFVVVLTAITAVTYAYVKFVGKVDMAAKKMKEWRIIQQQATESTQNERNEIKRLSDIIHNSSSSYSARKKAIEDLQKIVPEYQASLTKEGELINDNVDAIERYVKAMTLRAQAQATSSKLVEAQAKQERWYEENKKRVEDMLLAEMAYKQGLMGMPGAEKYDNPEQAAMRLFNMTPTVFRVLNSTWKKLEEEANMYQSMLDDIEAKLSKIYNEDANASGNNPETSDPATPTSDEKDTERNKRIREELEAIDAEYNNRAAALKQKYIDGEIGTEQEYSSRLQQIELERLRAKMQVAGLEEKQTSVFLQRIMDMEINVRKRIEEMTKVSSKDTIESRLEALKNEYESSKAYLKDAYDNGIIPSEKRYKEYLLALENNYILKKKELLEKQADEQIAELKKQQDAELQELKLHLAQRLLTEQEYEEALLRIRKKYADKRKEIQNQSKEATAATAKEEKEVEIAEAEEASEKLEKYAEQLKDIASDVQEAFGDLGEELSEAIFGGDFLEGMKNAGKEFLKQALDIVEKYIMIKQAQIMADQIAEASTFVGIATAILKATAKMAAIKMAFGLAKGAVSSFDVGGFTPNGRWDEPQGVVHSNEFVANRYAVKNPQVLPVLQLIDSAQRSGSISHLTGKEIAAVASGHAPSSQASANLPASQQQVQTIDLSPLYATLIRLEKVMDKATEAYKEPSPAYCYVNGRGGINEAQELNETINRNASRK